MNWRSIIVGMALLSLASCSPQRFFYYPNRNLYADPDRMGVKAQLVEFRSLNQKKLYGLFLPTDQKPRGTIVHFHGNFGNVSNHFPLALFLVEKGYDVLSFDYQGYGASEGKPTPKNLVEDGLAAVRYAQEHLRDPNTSVGVFGQSLGGAVAVVVAAQEPLVKSVVIEAAFAGYRTMGRRAMKRSLITYPLSPILPLFISTTYDPVKFVAKISPHPIFFIHGDADEVVPVDMSTTLYQAAAEPKTLWIIPGAKHLGGRHLEGEIYENRVTQYFDETLKKPEKAR